MKDRYHYLLLALLAILVGVLFLQDPGFGDDFTYWSFAFDLHERGLSAWQKWSFHDLRWPVWGVCWVLQGLFGFGLVAYYGEPILYLIVGSLIGFVMGRKLLGTAAAGWACAIAFLFHPLLDSVSYRPMPDLSEGVLGAGVMLAWWALMKAELPARRVAFTVLVGMGVFVCESNRLTGVFIVPVLVVNTLLFFRTRFLWLVAAGVVAVVCYAGEMWFYHGLFGDWWHNLHANLGGKGNKGTEAIALWRMPLRFLDSMWNGNPLAPFYCVLAVIGIPAAWRRHGTLGRVVVVWFTTLYLTYSCAPQDLATWRPLIRDADRFLCGLAIPFTVLVAAGLWALASSRAMTAACAWLFQKIGRPGACPPPWAVGAVAVLVLWAVTSRERFTRGFVPEFSAYMRALPAGTKIFTHESMRALAFLCDESGARRLSFIAPNHILQRNTQNEADAAQCEEFWYARKLMWMNTRKQIERAKLPKQPQLASFFDTPERDWVLKQVLTKGDAPDIAFFHRRTVSSPPPEILAASSPEFTNLLPALPAQWTRQLKTSLNTNWPVPVTLRGKLLRFEIEAASSHAEALTVRLRFQRGGTLISEYLLKPYLHAEGGKDFFVLPIPPDVEMCVIQLRFARQAQSVNFTSFRAIVESGGK